MPRKTDKTSRPVAGRKLPKPPAIASASGGGKPGGRPGAGGEPIGKPPRGEPAFGGGGGEPIEILLVEDSPDDADLTIEALRDGRLRNRVTHVEDGCRAISYLRHEGPDPDAVRPDLILLDWHLPKKNGEEVLKEIKGDPSLRRIPVVIMTSCDQESEVLKAYDLQANCFVVKPVDLDKFIGVVRSIESFWLSVVKLPAA